MENYFKIFDEYTDSSPPKFTYAVKDDEFHISAFCVEKFDVCKELDKINSLAKKYSVPTFG